ncbi:hypothetical protein FRC20_002914, partial [Serendipita sp. 405]
VVTDPYLLKEINVMTVTKEELAFKAPFELRVTRDDYVHAFLAWFDISFEACHKPVKFSTGPHSQYTHWKQTVFYTIDTMSVVQEDKIKGTLSCAPNERNNRDLDIVIEYELDGADGAIGREAKERIEYKMCVSLFFFSPPSFSFSIVLPYLPPLMGSITFACFFER